MNEEGFNKMLQNLQLDCATPFEDILLESSVNDDERCAIDQIRCT